MAAYAESWSSLSEKIRMKVGKAPYHVLETAYGKRVVWNLLKFIGTAEENNTVAVAHDPDENIVWLIGDRTIPYSVLPWKSPM